MGAEVENAYVHCGFVCVGKMPHTHTHTHSQTHVRILFGWTSVQMTEYWWILLRCLAGWAGGRTPTTRFLQSSKLQSS